MSEPQDTYEFTPGQNEIIAELSRGMRTVGLLQLLLGCFYLVAFLLALFHALKHPQIFGEVIVIGMVVLLLLAMGTWTSSAAASFAKIVTTQGKDITHLMDALDSLRKIYSLLRTIIYVYAILLLLTLLAAIIVAVVQTSK